MDTVTVKGSEHPMKFYTVNLDPELIKNKPDPHFEMKVDQKKRLRKDNKTDFLRRVRNGIIKTREVFDTNEDIQEIRVEYMKVEAELMP